MNLSARPLHEGAAPEPGAFRQEATPRQIVGTPFWAPLSDEPPQPAVEELVRGSSAGRGVAVVDGCSVSSFDPSPPALLDLPSPARACAFRQASHWDPDELERGPMIDAHALHTLLSSALLYSGQKESKMSCHSSWGSCMYTVALALPSPLPWAPFGCRPTTPSRGSSGLCESESLVIAECANGATPPSRRISGEGGTPPCAEGRGVGGSKELKLVRTGTCRCGGR